MWDLGHVDVTTEQTLILLGSAHPKVKRAEVFVDQNVKPMSVTFKLWMSKADITSYGRYRRWMDYWWDAKTIPGKIIRNWSMRYLGQKKLWDLDFLLYKSVSEFLGETPVAVELIPWEN